MPLSGQLHSKPLFWVLWFFRTLFQRAQLRRCVALFCPVTYSRPRVRKFLCLVERTLYSRSKTGIEPSVPTRPPSPVILTFLVVALSFLPSCLPCLMAHGNILTYSGSSVSQNAQLRCLCSPQTQALSALMLMNGLLHIPQHN